MSDFIKALITGRQLRSIMIVKELQMDNDPPYFGLFLALTLGVTIVFPQVIFNGFPNFCMAKTSQQYSQSVIVKFYLTYGFTQQTLQSVLVFLNPIIYAILSMVSFRQDECEPDSSQPAIGKPLVMPMITNMFVYDFG